MFLYGLVLWYSIDLLEGYLVPLSCRSVSVARASYKNSLKLMISMERRSEGEQKYTDKPVQEPRVHQIFIRSLARVWTGSSV